MKLDRSRAYSERYPAAYAAYEQDGKLFNRDGDEVPFIPDPAPTAEEMKAEAEQPEVRKIDLRKKENAHLRRKLAA